MSLPIIAITLGDPAGIGPEVIVGAWRDVRLFSWCRPFVVGRPEILERAAQLAGSSSRIQIIESPGETQADIQTIPCLVAGALDAARVPPGRVDARAGQAAYDSLRVATRLALECQVAAITTAPLNKAALWQAGHRYPGHTELLAEWCGVREFAMMLYLAPDAMIRGPAGLGVVHVTLHVSLREALAGITVPAIVEKAGLAERIMRRLKGSAPRIGLCALNPHAGEEGLFGDEEQRIIAPAAQAVRTAGIDVEGPCPADSLFVRAREGQFDGVVAMYHDQGHIALKLLGMHRAVNVTLGLPIVRTSVAHGTAFDRAWTGQAESSSMVEAIRVAAVLADRSGGGCPPLPCRQTAVVPPGCSN